MNINIQFDVNENKTFAVKMVNTDFPKVTIADMSNMIASAQNGVLALFADYCHKQKITDKRKFFDLQKTMTFDDLIRVTNPAPTAEAPTPKTELTKRTKTATTKRKIAVKE